MLKYLSGVFIRMFSYLVILASILMVILIDAVYFQALVLPTHLAGAVYTTLMLILTGVVTTDLQQSGAIEKFPEW